MPIQETGSYLCLIAALVQRVIPQARTPLPQRRRSVFAEARAMAVSAIPFVFMG